jgi:hypothetical protein
MEKTSRTAAYYAANSERLKANARAWRVANPDAKRAYNKAYYAANGERLRANMRTYLLGQRYGLTPEAIQKQLQLQRGKCALCRKPFTEARRPVVDHDHRTGAFRGLLHRGCNTLIGQIEHHREAIKAYLAGEMLKVYGEN